MQQQLKEMQKSIDTQLRMRGGQDKPQQGPSKVRRATRGKRAAMSKASGQTIEDPVAPVEEGNEDSGDSHHDIADLPVVENGVPAADALDVPTDTTTNTVNEAVPPSSSEKTVTETEPDKDAIVSTSREKHVDQVVDAALTPPSDMPKDTDDLLTNLPAVKPTSNGVETPETTVADQATSPAGAEAIEIDGFDLE